jgi:type I restriction enzyme R subunit
LFHLSYWLARTYGRSAHPDATLTFSPNALPRTSSIAVAKLTQLQEIARRFADTVKARDEAERQRLASEAEHEKLDAEIKALQAQVAAAKAANARASDTRNYDEATTRDAFIDLLLGEVGWNFTRPGYDTEYPVKGMPNASGEGFVDYVLWGDDGKPLGIVEAKRTPRDARVGQQQAKLYADCLEAEFGQRPIIFYSNGYEHCLWNDARYPPRPVSGFLSKDELELAIRRRST